MKIFSTILSIAIIGLTIESMAADELEIWDNQEHKGHSKQNPNHWYPPNCCSQRDCEPTPIDGITDTGDGWKIHYVSERFGLVDEFIKLGTERKSRDGGFHGCWRLNPETKPRTICFFAPLNA